MVVLKFLVLDEELKPKPRIQAPAPAGQVSFLMADVSTRFTMKGSGNSMRAALPHKFFLMSSRYKNP